MRWFWAIVERMPQEQRARLLQFATGSPRVPPGGFQALRGMQGPQRFTLALSAIEPTKAGGHQALPTASTCFNLLRLPPCSSEEALEDALHIAVQLGAEGFSFA